MPARRGKSRADMMRAATHEHQKATMEPLQKVRITVLYLCSTNGRLWPAGGAGARGRGGGVKRPPGHK